MKIRSIFIGAAIGLLAGCGSATDAVTFQAPPAYHSKVSIGPFMQVWSGAPHNDIVLISLPVQTDLDNTLSQAKLKDAKLQKKEHIKICGDEQDALLMSLEGEAKVDSEDEQSRPPSEIEFLATNVGGKTYLAMYARPLHSPADPAAQAAIRNVCPK